MKKQTYFLLIAVFLLSAFAVFRINPSAATDTEVSYARDIRPLLASRCGQCHTGEFVSAGLDVGSYESLLAGSENGVVIRPGQAASSPIIQILKSGEMPKRGPRLTPAQIQLIADWIDAGAHNN